VPWSDASLTGGGWYLKAHHVPVPPVSLNKGRERHDEVRRRRFILLSDLRDDLAFDINSCNWIMFETWEFDPRRRAGYLGMSNSSNEKL
jgi:hypothetical protein